MQSFFAHPIYGTLSDCLDELVEETTEEEQRRGQLKPAMASRLDSSLSENPLGLFWMDAGPLEGIEGYIILALLSHSTLESPICFRYILLLLHFSFLFFSFILFHRHLLLLLFPSFALGVVAQPSPARFIPTRVSSNPIQSSQVKSS